MRTWTCTSATPAPPSLLSAGAGGGNGVFDATFRAVSADGRRVFFRTAESLLAADTDGVADVYSANVPGTVTVVLDTIPDDPQDFSFTAGGGISPPSFQLDDDADGTLSNTRAFANLTPGSGYSLSQALPTGWSEVSATCDDGSPVSDIDLAAGETVTCTFVDQRGYPRPKRPRRCFRWCPPIRSGLRDRSHGPSLISPSCTPPVLRPPAHRRPPDANGEQANMAGHALPGTGREPGYAGGRVGRGDHAQCQRRTPRPEPR